jgi:hypothetical protein
MARLETSGTMNCGVLSLSALTLSTACKHEGEVDTLDKFKDILNFRGHSRSATTKNMEFDELMKLVEEDKVLSQKVIISAQPEYLVIGKERYWHKKFKKAGFRLIRKAKNPTGATIWFYMRIPNPIPIIKGDR